MTIIFMMGDLWRWRFSSNYENRMFQYTLDNWLFHIQLINISRKINKELENGNVFFSLVYLKCDNYLKCEINFPKRLELFVCVINKSVNNPYWHSKLLELKWNSSFKLNIIIESILGGEKNNNFMINYLILIRRSDTSGDIHYYATLI